ncbi:MAG: agmatine deiminase family protein [Muribaculaceae bacterium]|nr:agmatine deiminase family protein [Muribaculaceae bacterium]
MKSKTIYRAEWELDGPILLALPHEETDWAEILDEAIDQYKLILTALDSHNEKVLLLVHDVEKAKLQLADCPLNNVTLIEVPTNDTWTRDYGPISVIKHGDLRLLDFGFNGWGLKFSADKDNLVNLHLAEKGVLNQSAYRNRRGFILEGGSIDTDGEGTLLTTSQCLLSPNRNAEYSRAEINEKLSRDLGVDHILWLDYGALIGDDTDSHIDTLCRMAPENIILFTGCRDEDDPQFEDLLKMRAQLTLFRNRTGESYNLVELPLPDAIYGKCGSRLPATYANYLVTPRAVYMPTYNQPQKDFLACQTIRIAFPNHEVVPVDCSTLIKQHGSLHCSTMTILP